MMNDTFYAAIVGAFGGVGYVKLAFDKRHDTESFFIKEGQTCIHHTDISNS